MNLENKEYNITDVNSENSTSESDELSDFSNSDELNELALRELEQPMDFSGAGNDADQSDFGGTDSEKHNSILAEFEQENANTEEKSTETVVETEMPTTNEEMIEQYDSENLNAEIISEEMHSEISEEVPAEVSEEISEPVYEEVAAEVVSEEISEPVYEEVAAEVVSEEISEPVFEEVAVEVVSEEISEPTYEEVPMEIVSEVPETEYTPEAVSFETEVTEVSEIPEVSEVSEISEVSEVTEIPVVSEVAAETEIVETIEELNENTSFEIEKEFVEVPTENNDFDTTIDVSNFSQPVTESATVIETTPTTEKVEVSETAIQNSIAEKESEKVEIPPKPIITVDEKQARITAAINAEVGQAKTGIPKQIYIFGALFLLAVIITAVILIVNKQNNKLDTVAENTETTVTDNAVTVEDNSAVVEDNSAVVEEKSDTTKTETTNTQPLQSSTPNKWGVQMPCSVISVGAFGVEKTAKEQVELLKKNGFQASYYWIPDVIKGGKQLFKVYVGPYSSLKDAQTSLESVKKVSKDAYTEELK